MLGLKSVFVVIVLEVEATAESGRAGKRLMEQHGSVMEVFPAGARVVNG